MPIGVSARSIDEQLAYAQTDTHYLLQLRDDLEAKLAEMGRLEEAQEIFVEQSTVRLPDVSNFRPILSGVSKVQKSLTRNS